MRHRLNPRMFSLQAGISPPPLAAGRLRCSGIEDDGSFIDRLRRSAASCSASTRCSIVIIFLISLLVLEMCSRFGAVQGQQWKGQTVAERSAPALWEAGAETNREGIRNPQSHANFEAFSRPNASATRDFRLTKSRLLIDHADITSEPTVSQRRRFSAQATGPRPPLAVGRLTPSWEIEDDGSFIDRRSRSAASSSASTRCSIVIIFFISLLASARCHLFAPRRSRDSFLFRTFPCGERGDGCHVRLPANLACCLDSTSPTQSLDVEVDPDNAVTSIT